MLFDWAPLEPRLDFAEVRDRLDADPLALRDPDFRLPVLFEPALVDLRELDAFGLLRLRLDEAPLREPPVLLEALEALDLLRVLFVDFVEPEPVLRLLGLGLVLVSAMTSFRWGQLFDPDLLFAGSEPFLARRDEVPFDDREGDLRSVFRFTSPSSIVPRQPPSSSSFISA